MLNSGWWPSVALHLKKRLVYALLHCQLKAMRTIDFAIIGAGMTGLSTAYWLKKYGLNGCVFEHANKGAGASGKNAGFLTCGSLSYYEHLRSEIGAEKAKEVWDFCQTNHDLLYKEIIEGNEWQLNYSRGGSITAAFTDEFAKWLTHAATKHHLYKSRQIEPATNLPLKGIKQAHHYLGDGSINPQQLVFRLAQQAQTEIYENCQLRFSCHNNETHIQTATQKFVTQKLIIATNGYSSQWLPDLKPFIKPVRAQCLKTEPVTKRFFSNIYLPESLSYLRQDDDGCLIYGGMRTADTETENTGIEAINPKIQQSLIDHLVEIVGHPLQIKAQWSGIMGFSSTTLPIVLCERGSDSTTHRVLLGGYSGHGMGMTFLSGQRLAQWLMHSTALPSFFTQRDVDLSKALH